jgi:hypothetical protein
MEDLQHASADNLLRIVDALAEAGLVRMDAPTDARRLLSPRVGKHSSLDRLREFTHRQLDVARRVQRRVTSADAHVDAHAMEGGHALPAALIAWAQEGRHELFDPHGILGFLLSQPLEPALSTLAFITTALPDADSVRIMSTLREFVAHVRTAAKQAASAASPMSLPRDHGTYTALRAVNECLQERVLPDLMHVPWVRTFMLQSYFGM